ncbi:sugar O-acetyltransferase [Ramlibacter sp. Leaf400]|uniref:sugar O-acetyltransferase n=1 Tax=Ramlibacter sp. Leaf400 TaxID=1736365 RepID=UPI0006FC85EA|nr:sugar O-acetyltransferase [Ramlibacter sp. Leaf400]KQT11595.1 maltose acetyltransferase [Ramlibacter sp. Leaf400]
MPSERDKMLAGEPYDARAPELVQARERARLLCARINQLAPDDPQRKAALQELLGAGGDSAIVTSPFHCDYGAQIELGEGVYFNFNCVVLDVCRVRIGARTLLGPAVQVYTPLHPMDAVQRRQAECGRPVEIGCDVWIGGGAIVLPGVRIGDRAVIGAGSVVTRDVPADVFAAGNPCRVVRSLP